MVEPNTDPGQDPGTVPTPGAKAQPRPKPDPSLLERLNRVSDAYAPVHTRVELFARLDELSGHLRALRRDAFRVVKLSQLDPKLYGLLLSAIRKCGTDPHGSLADGRSALEFVAADLYARLVAPPTPGEHLALDRMLSALDKDKHLPKVVMTHARSVQMWGNVGAHRLGEPSPEDAAVLLGHLLQLVKWYYTGYRSDRLPPVVALTWWLENWRRTTRLAAAAAVLLLAGAGSYLGYKVYTHVDPCTLPVFKCPDPPEDRPPAGDKERPLAPPNPVLKYCTMTVVNRTGKPIRLWRYFLEPPPPAIVSASPPAGTPAPPAAPDPNSPVCDDPHWVATVICDEEAELHALTGWAYVTIENLEESVEAVRNARGGHEPFLSDYPPYAAKGREGDPQKGWRFFPYRPRLTVEIQQPFFDNPMYEGNFVITAE
jgi:hypothetical protein